MSNWYNLACAYIRDDRLGCQVNAINEPYINARLLIMSIQDFELSKLDPTKKTILVVDDEDVIRHLLCDILDMLGYNVILSATPEYALEIYTHYRQHLSLILMDMMMPGMNGLQLYRKMNAIDKDNKVVILSGYSILEGVEELLDEGVLGFIQKPVTIKKLEEVILNALSIEDTVEE